MTNRDVTWDDLTWSEKRAVLRADVGGAWRVFRTRTPSTPATDRKVEAIYNEARKRIAKGKH